MEEHTITGGGGTKLHVRETGNKQGRPLLFIHGLSQCGLCWKKQMESDLADDFRLVAIDARGHGLSEKPQDAYGDTQLWADDVNGVITELGLDQPVLIGWSYAGLIISDYLRHYGDKDIAGINFIGAISKIGDSIYPFLSPEFIAMAGGLFSDVAAESTDALGQLIRLWFYRELPLEEFYFFLGYNSVVPPYVRGGAFGRSQDNDDVLAKLSKPALISQGEADALVLMSMAEHHDKVIEKARLAAVPEAGHAPFWETPERYNADLRSFVGSI